MTDKSFNIIGLGEILWDILPTGKHLGGAPANFAYISKQLGNNGIVLSRVGNDGFGQEILDELKTKKISTDFIQIDAENPTGTVKVKLENGQPSYEIVENVAWDFLEFTESWNDVAERCDAVCFGSLAQRGEVSRKTIRKFVEKAKGLRIFDVNLRRDYFSNEILYESFRLADIVKLNHEELPVISGIFEIEGANLVKTAERLLSEFSLKIICVTRGGNGSLLITKDAVSEHEGLEIKIADTIGAGDSFTAGMTHGILRGWTLEQTNDFANKVGAFVASNAGAMPDFSNFESL
ncbi:MAG: carbohydrate kinase [Pyrinomonadaceae bacterium]|nr:carbohydrate kinase [Pyrinomonadaceae bacterium]